MTMRLSRALRVGFTLAAALGLSISSAPAIAEDGPADPALQQVVTDNEPLDRDSQVVFDHGHCDLGPRLIDGKWELLARDDTQSPSVWRPIDQMVFKVGDASIMELPEGDAYGFVGAKAGSKVYVIPQSEIPNVPWLGWSSQSPAVVNGVDGQMQLIFEGHQGPGQFTNFYQAGNFGGPQQNWSSATKEAQVINVDLNTHVHTNWVFTEPGIHLVKVTAKAKLKDGTDVSESHVLKFAVGDGTSVDETRAAQWQESEQPQAQAHPADDAKAVGDTPQSSRTMLIAVGGGLVVIGVVALVAAFVLIRSSRRRRAAALAAARPAPAPGSDTQTDETGDDQSQSEGERD